MADEQTTTATDAPDPRQIPLPGTGPKQRRAPAQRRNRKPKAPAFTGRFADGLVIEYKDARLITDFRAAPLRMRIARAWAILRGKAERRDGPLRFIVHRGDAPSVVMNIADELRKDPSIADHPQTRSVFE